MSDPKWLVINEIELDSGSEFQSGGVVGHPTRTYEGRVLDWGSMEASIPAPSGIPRVGDALIRVADTDRKWRNLLSVQTPRRRRVTTKFLQEGDSEATAAVIFSGEVKDGTFPEGVVELQQRDTTFSWIDEMLPELVNQQNFPTFPDVNPGFFPVVLGHCQSRAIPPGSSSGGPVKDPTGDSALMASKIASAASIIAAYTAFDVTAPGPRKVDRWIIGVETPFGQALSLVIDEINRQWSNGAMLLSDLTDARDAVQDNIDAFLAKAASVGAIDSEFLQITNQAIQNQHNIFGASFELLLDPIDAKIYQLSNSPSVIASYVQGVIPLPHIGYLAGTGDRWAAAVHQLWNVLAIYRKLPNETIFTVVDPAEFDVVEEATTFLEWPTITFNCVFIDFISQQPDGTEIRMDADGFYFRDTWNGMAAVGYDGVSLFGQGPLRNPIDAFIHLTRVLFLKASAESGWDGVDIEAVYDKLKNGTDFTPPYFCDASVTEAMTPRDLLGLFMQSFGLDFSTKMTGLQSLAFLTEEDPLRQQITEEMMVKGSFIEHISNPTINQLTYKFSRDYAEDKWFSQAVFDNAYDQTLLGEIEKGDLELWFVRDQGTAVSVAQRYMENVSLGSYQQEWQSPLPLVLDRMELAQQVGITHRSGLTYLTGYEDREVKVIGRTIDLNRMTVNYRSILRVPVRLPAEEAPESAHTVDIVYADSSPRSGGNASRYFFILDVDTQELWSSKRAAPLSGSFAAFVAETIPAGAWLKLASMTNVGFTGCFGSDANIMTKGLPAGTSDEPWTKYATPSALHGGGSLIGISDPLFWTPSVAGGEAIAAINPSNEILSGLTSVAGATFDSWSDSSNTPTAGTWNKVVARISNTIGNYRNALAIGNGSIFLRFYENGYSDTAWQSFPCPSGDWRDIATGPYDDYAFCVGVGADAACAGNVYPLEELFAFSMPAGWVGIDPRVIFDPNMYDVSGGNDGTYIIVGGEIAGVSVVVLVPITDSGETLLTPILATLPSVPADVKWQAIATNQIYEGVLIVGHSATDGICILSNPETTNAGDPATYDDWTLKTLADAPL